jgi:hypothetical protein
MRGWFMEIAGWLLLAFGLWIFYDSFEWMREGKITQTGPHMVIGFIVFRGGLQLIKMAVAARICLQIQRVPPAERASAPTRQPAHAKSSSRLL